MEVNILLLVNLSLILISAEGGIRTHEAFARDLKTRPFDHSGTPAKKVSFNEVLRTRLELVTLAL